MLAVPLSLLVTASAVITPGDGPSWRQAPTVLVLPFAAHAGAHRDLAYGLELKALGSLHALDAVHVVHPKIRSAVIRRRALASAVPSPEEGIALGRTVGATWVLAGTIRPDDVSLRLVEVAGPRARTATAAGASLTAAVEAMPKVIFHLLESVDPRGRALGKVNPASNDPEALARLATCYRMLDQQSVGILTPALVDERRSRQAANRCRAALRHASDLPDAEAGLAMAAALDGDGPRASALLVRTEAQDGFLPYGLIAKFWLLAKQEDPKLAISALRSGVERFPGFLLGRVYLGDALSAVGRHEEALAVYLSYLEAVPNEPYVMARSGHELARLGKTEEAITATERALALDPSDRNTQLELGSRLIDAERWADAIARLEPLADEPDAKGEVHLRLGYAHLRLGQLDEAEPELRLAIERAEHRSEWRTVGRASYNIAQVLARKGQTEAALDALEGAVRAGFQRPELFRRDRDLASLRKLPRFETILAASPARPEVSARLESPFIEVGEAAAREAAQKSRRPGRRSTVSY